MATVCQADQINQKRSPFYIDGILNLVLQEYKSEASSGQGAILGLIRENLKGEYVDKLDQNRYNLTGLFGSSSYETASINSLSSSDLGIPFIDAGDLSNSYSNNFYSSSKIAMASNRTLYQILDTYNYNTFSAVLDVADYFNWTLIGSIYEANSFGFDQQKNVIFQSYTDKNSTINFACNYLFYINEIKSGSGMITADVASLSDYCNCVKDKNILSVTILWMKLATAAIAIRNIRETCSGTESWTFLVAGDFEGGTTDSVQLSGEYLKNSLLIRNFGPWNFNSFLENCLETASPEAMKVILPLLDKFTLYAYNCQLSNQDGLNECEGSLTDRKLNDEPCHCNTQVFVQDPYSVKNCLRSSCVILILSYLHRTNFYSLQI